MQSTEKQVTIPKKAGKKRATLTPARLLAQCAIEAMFEKKAHDIVIMNMQQVSGVADFFLIGTGDSDLHIKAISRAIQDRIRERFSEKAWHAEGKNFNRWVLLDYVDLVVHIFNHEKRAFYDLERLWGDAPREEVSDDVGADQILMLQETKGA